MAKKNRLPSDLDEKIQSLAGDIYLQIEEKVADFVLANQLEVEITAEQIEQHPVFKKTSQRLTELVKDSADAQVINREENNKNLAIIASLEQRNSEFQQKIKNTDELNTAKLTDTESILKTKLNEVSVLERQLSDIKKQESSQSTKLQQSTQELLQLEEKLLATSHDKQHFQKSDQAKSVTLDVQNKKITELNNQVNTVSAELEQAKTEHINGILSASEHSSDSQKQLTLLNERISILVIQLSDEQELGEKQKQQVELLSNALDENENQCKDLIKNNEILQETNDKNKTNTQQQNEVIKQQADELNSAQKSILVLKKSQNSQQTIIGELKAHLAQAEINHAKNTKEHEYDKKSLQEKMNKLNEEAEQGKLQQTHLIDQLTDSKKEYNLAQKNIDGLHEKQLVLTDELAKKQELIGKEKQRFIDEQSDNLKVKKAADDKVIKLNKRLNTGEERQAASAQALIQLQQSYDNLAILFEQGQHDIELQGNNISDLEQQISETKVGNVQAKQRAEVNRNKQELEYNKARETIKYLRDENTELNKQLEQQVADLETQLTEYRLRFEYAQKQLAKQ